ncbi:MAG: hypothetical protein H6934_08195 [Burkholderiaceae bacterium]|nr:hypothetical protein [Burkholderiaceae bacterium]
MQIEKLPARHGWRWIIEALRLFGRQPMALLSLTAFSLLLVWVPTAFAQTILPAVAWPIPMLLTPLVTVGMVSTARDVDRGKPPMPSVLFAGFRASGPWRKLLILGAINALASRAIVGLAAVFSGMDAGSLALTDGIASDEAAQLPAFDYTPLAVVALLMVPLQMTMWYAPLFVAWNDASVPKSLFFSFAAVMRNRWAFLIYVFSWVLLVGLSLKALMLVVPSQAARMLLTFPVFVLVSSLIYCATWLSYRDAVRDSEQPELRPPAA